MMILVDSREHQHAIEEILQHFDLNEIRHASTKLYVGDYQEVGNGLLVVDRKQNLLELVSNVCQQHERFRNELLRAEEAGIQLVILCEHGHGIRSLEDVAKWENPRRRSSPHAMNGDRLAKILKTMTVRYGVEFQFCDKKETGQKIVEILSNERLGKDLPQDTRQRPMD